MSLVGHEGPEDIPCPFGTLEWERQWDCDVFGGTQESQGCPIVWDDNYWSCDMGF